jgi:hypothetical protein
MNTPALLMHLQIRNPTKQKTLFIRGGRKGEAIKPHLTLIKWLISFWGRIINTVRRTFKSVYLKVYT